MAKNSIIWRTPIADTAYRTTDRQVYADRNAAEAHQKRLDFLEWYDGVDGDVLLGNYEGSKIDAENLLEWLLQNRVLVLDLLQEGGAS